MNFFFVLTNWGALLLWHQQTTVPPGAQRAAAITAICFRSAMNGTLLNTLEMKTLLYCVPASTSSRKRAAISRLFSLCIFSPTVTK